VAWRGRCTATIARNFSPAHNPAMPHTGVGTLPTCCCPSKTAWKQVGCAGSVSLMCPDHIVLPRLRAGCSSLLPRLRCVQATPPWASCSSPSPWMMSCAAQHPHCPRQLGCTCSRTQALWAKGSQPWPSLPPWPQRTAGQARGQGQRQRQPGTHPSSTVRRPPIRAHIPH
jgi:hypothetical protein